MSATNPNLALPHVDVARSTLDSPARRPAAPAAPDTASRVRGRLLRMTDFRIVLLLTLASCQNPRRSLPLRALAAAPIVIFDVQTQAQPADVVLAIHAHFKSSFSSRSGGAGWTKYAARDWDLDASLC